MDKTIDMFRLRMELEQNFIYEIQNIPQYRPFQCTIKYFANRELDKFISEGLEEYVGENDALLYAATKCLKVLIEDIDNETDKAKAIWENGGNPKEAFQNLVNDYEAIMEENNG